MYLSGFADEASATWEGQIKATKALGWKYIETRKLFDGNLASITDAQFEQVRKDLEENGLKFNAYGSGIANWSHPINKEAESSYEEMQKAIDLGGFYRIPADGRDLNYDKYTKVGIKVSDAKESYNSFNTERLDVDGVIEKLLSLDYVQAELANQE